MFTLSPLGRRRLAHFKANRRGWWSLWLFIGLFTVCLGGELIANDKPLAIHYKDHWYFPIVSGYEETDFGGELPFEPDYSSDYVRKLIAGQGGWMLFAPIPFSYDTVNYDLTQPAPSPPSSSNWLGTDDQARDVLARVIFGARISILFALILTAISAVVGITAGALQGFYGGMADMIGQRLQEVWAGLPVLYLLIILSGFIAPSFWWLLGIMALFSWLALVDVVRAEFLRGRNLEYVKAARALGLTNGALMRRHILPECHDLDPDLPALHPHRRHRHPDRPGLSGLRHATRHRLAGRAYRPGQAQPAGALAGPDRVLRTGADFVATGVYRRSLPRCF